MCLVGFPENIESCCIKLNKHQAQLVPVPIFTFFSFLFRLSLLPNEKVSTCVWGNWYTLANAKTHSKYSLFPSYTVHM